MGHVLLVVQPPSNIWRHSPEAHELQAAWPPGDVPELWLLRTLESTRAEEGLHESTMMLYVERGTGKLMLIGEITADGGLALSEHEAVELWQSPAELRSSLRVDLMAEAVVQMKEHERSWSSVTAARAVLRSARIEPRAPYEKAQAMEKIKASWFREPICTSVAIIFWQRYLKSLAEAAAPVKDIDPFDLILKWMPLKADRGLPGDLLGTMKQAGWVSVPQIPRIFRPLVVANHVAPRPLPQKPRELLTDASTSDGSTASEVNVAAAAAAMAVESACGGDQWLVEPQASCTIVPPASCNTPALAG